MRPLPLRSSAVSATSRLNAPLTEPSARPIADVAPGTGRLTAVAVVSLPVARVSFGVFVAPVRPLSVPLFGNARPVVLPIAGVDAAVEAPLDADRLGEVARGLHDAGFDFDLRLGPIERAEQRRRRSAADPAGR